MRYLPKINKKRIVILLLMQLTLAYALPACASLNLCIGFDGHVDIESGGFGGRATLPFPQTSVVPVDNDHHGDCFDIEIDSFLFEYLYVRTDKFRFQNKECGPQIKSEGALSSDIGLSQLTPNLSHSPNNFTSPSSAHLFPRTVVLII